MGHGVILLHDDVGDADARIERAMSARLAEALAALLLEDPDLRTARFTIDDAEHSGARHERRAGEQFAALFCQKQDLLEGDRGPGIACSAIHLDGLTRRYLHLTTPGLN